MRPFNYFYIIYKIYLLQSSIFIFSFLKLVCLEYFIFKNIFKLDIYTILYLKNYDLVTYITLT